MKTITTTKTKEATSEHASSTRSAEWMDISPVIAENMLTFNRKNRPLTESWVNKIKTEIEAGNWKETGQAIIFGQNGDLLNGQHVLNAIVRAGKTVRALVVRGVDNDAFKAMDTGVKRTAAHVLAMGGEIDSKRLAAAVTFVGRYNAGAMRNRGFTLTPIQVEDLLVEHSEIRESVKYIAELKSIPLPFSISAGLHYLFVQSDKKLGSGLFEKLATGAGLEAGDPILLLRERLLENKNSRVGKLDGTHLAALTIKAFNHALRGESPAFLRFRAGGENAEQFPKIAKLEEGK